MLGMEDVAVLAQDIETHVLENADTGDLPEKVARLLREMRESAAQLG
jgi:chemotaxis methyl-accepting protein methylase